MSLKKVVEKSFSELKCDGRDNRVRAGSEEERRG